MRTVWRYRSARRALGVALVLSCLSFGRAGAFRYVKVGDPAPPLAVEDLGGIETRPSFFDTLTIVLFFRPGQPFSLAALRDAAAIAREFQGKGVQVLAISEPSRPPGEIGAFVKEQGLPFPVFFDRGNRAQETYGVIVLPSTGIVDGHRRLVFYQPSRNSNYKEIIEGKLRVLLGQMTEEDFSARLARLGESFGEGREAAERRYRQGLALFQEGRREEAARELAEAIRLFPEFPDAHLLLGHVLLETGDARGALRQFEHVLERNPQSPSAKIGIGIAEIGLGELDRGIGTLEEAVSLNPDPVRGYAELAKAYEAKGDSGKALHYYKRAIKKLLQGRE